MVDDDNLSIADFNTSVGLFSAEHVVFANEIEFRTKVTIPWYA